MNLVGLVYFLRRWGLDEPAALGSLGGETPAASLPTRDLTRRFQGRNETRHIQIKVLVFPACDGILRRYLKKGIP